MTTAAPDFRLAWNTSLDERHDARPASAARQFAGGSFSYQDGRVELEACLPSWSTERYVEPPDQTGNTSFVLLMGACLWKRGGSSWLSAGDLKHCLDRHRSAGTPPFDELDGNFCLISYDHRSESLWIATDFWATVAFYYGARQNLVAVASRAAVVADRIQAPIDAVAYLSLLRSAVPPAGSSLFSGVSRITMGHALRLTPSSVGPVAIGPLYREPERWSFRESVDRTKLCLRTVAADCVSRPQTVVDLTGGNDTRLIAAALAARPDLTASLTFRVVGPPTSPDVEIATAMAKHFEWRLVAHPPVLGGLSVDGAPAVALAADGSFSLDLIANRLLLEATRWPDARHLVGGLAGELFRSWIWQQELHRMGRSTTINYAALLRHRVPRDHGVDTSVLTGGRLDNRTHDECLIEPLRRLDAQHAAALNVAKLDLYYIQRLMHRIPWWGVASRLVTILPFLWTSVTDVSLRLPWRHKRTRRLVTTVVEELDPWIATLPTDRGAPFQPLRLATAVAYASYLSSYTSDIIRRHYLRQSPAPIQLGPRPPATPARDPLPAELTEWLPLGRSCLHDDQGLIEDVRCGNAGHLSESRRTEFLTILQLELLFRHYREIKRELRFP